ncbi:FecR family protein [Sphingobacterium haloxyli]|uniref:FecR protein domain-containing protein n=1 Tax=Sphingobacterium haloxyli TaxID=2100533 RepID=A0A2S9J0M8_9SPHI|nr:FecR domain-containing protein [Sphingobacterium haloxyli]PRD46336.1 hypothetical protein C5745_16275 [Sphingobacterium haloxyli]
MMGNKTRKSIQAFWKGRLTKAEAKELLDKLDNQQPALQRQLKRELVDASENPELLSAKQSAELLQAIRNKAGMQTPVKRMYPYKWVSAAAVVVLIGIFGIFYKQKNTEIVPETVYAEAAPPETYVVNTQQDSLTYLLSDGSAVLLSPHSTICYDKSYGIRNRSIQLRGEGKFVVVRDSTLPFEVMANGFTTTALGTEFIVDGRNLDKTTVHLLSGKVVIRSSKEARMSIQDTYLAVGEMLYIDEASNTVLTNPVAAPKPTMQPANADQRIASSDQRQNLRFDRQDLAEVLRQIAIKFDKAIRIDPAVPRNLTFTGEFSADDDLETILSTICLVNDLQRGSGDEDEVLILLKDTTVHHQTPDTTSNKVIE